MLCAVIATECSEWRCGESARLSPLWPGFDSRMVPYVMVEFVVGSRLDRRAFFLGFSGFTSSTKPNTPNSNSTRIWDPHENQLRVMWLSLKEL